MNKKILIANNVSYHLRSWRIELIDELLTHHELIIACNFTGDDRKFFEDRGCICIHTAIDRRGMNPFKDGRLLLQYFKILLSHKPDIILSFTPKINTYCGFACAILRIPNIITVNGLGSAFQKDNLLCKILLMVFKFNFTHAKYIFCQNTAIKDFFEKREILKKNNCSVINGSGVNLQKFQVLPYPAEDKPMSFLYIGRMMDEKGIPELMEAAKRILADFPDVEFHFIGGCENGYEEKMQAWQKQKGIFYHGAQKDVRPFLEKAHCLVHPTYYPEGISNACLEAAACGRPIMVSNIPGCKETFDESVSGFGIEVNNVDDLVKKLHAFIDLPYSKKENMGLAGRKKVEAEFDRKRVVKNYTEAISYGL